MSATAALTIDDTMAEMSDPAPTAPEGLTLPADMIQDAQEGLVRLSKMSPNELSSLIERRVEMPNSEISVR